MSISPSSGYRDEWLFTRPIIRTNLKNDTFVIPAFGNTCGRRNGCLNISSMGVLPLMTNIVGAIAHTSFSMCVDLKIGNQSYSDVNADQAIMQKSTANGLGGMLDVQLGYKNNIIIYLQGSTGFTPIKIDTGIIITPYQWVNLIVNRGQIGAFSTLEVWVNGVLSYSNYAIVNTNDTDTSFFFACLDAGGQEISGKFANFKLYFPALSTNYILSSFNRISFYTPDLIKATAYLNYAFNTANGTIVTDLAGHGTNINIDNVTQTVVSDDFPPVIYGASFIACSFPLTLPSTFSFVYPIAAPTPGERDHAMAVSWTDNKEVFQRRWLYHADDDGATEDVSPIYVDYAGEPIISPFTLEIWNIDGRNKVNLAAPITIRLSTVTQPSLGNDRTSAVVATPVLNQVLAVQFPSTDPLTVSLKQIY